MLAPSPVSTTPGCTTVIVADPSVKPGALIVTVTVPVAPSTPCT